MKTIKDNSIDIVISDLPYGALKNLEWDTPINLVEMWKQLWRICKERTPICLFGNMKFGVALINSCPKHFKYEMVWNKQKSTTPFLSRQRFGMATEYVFFFYKKPPVYNYLKYHKVLKREKKAYFNGSFVGAKKVKKQTNYYTPSLPINVFETPVKRHDKVIKAITEKPQAILEHLLKYFSNEGDTCLDMCMGSGSMGVACKTLNRKFIGIEMKTEHYWAAVQRLIK